jgi:hypothetical protein
MSSILDSMKATAHAAIDGFNQWDIDAIMMPRAENCTHLVLPRSLGRKELNNEGYRPYFAAIMPLLRKFRVGPP